MNKYVRQAKLPKAAYSHLTAGLEHYAVKDNKPRTKWCPNHVTKMIDDKYEVCWHCFKKGK